MPALVARAAGRHQAEVEANWLAAKAGHQPVGAGGAADTGRLARATAPAPVLEPL
jgi:hypothetical protein